MRCEIAGCEEVARFDIAGIGYACAECAREVINDLELDEEEEVRRI
jgi:hypothetical protein